MASKRRMHWTQPENKLSDASGGINDLFVLLISHLTSLSLIFFISKALVLIILLPIGVSLIWLSMRIMLGSIPDIPNHILLGGSENLYFKQRNEFEKPESCSSGCCETFWLVKYSTCGAIVMRLSHCTVNTIIFTLRWNFLEGDSKSRRWERRLPGPTVDGSCIQGYSIIINPRLLDVTYLV